MDTFHVILHSNASISSGMSELLIKYIYIDGRDVIIYDRYGRNNRRDSRDNATFVSAETNEIPLTETQ